MSPCITFDQLLQTELRAHGAAGAEGDDSQVTLEGPNVIPLRSATMQTFALALHELMINALKYGALSRPEGRLDVRWSLVPGQGSEQRLRVDWRETGVPVTPPGGTPGSQAMDSMVVPMRKGYGCELIERALPYQLRAQTDHEITPEDVRCTIIVPVSSTPDMAFSNPGDAGDADA